MFRRRVVDFANGPLGLVDAAIVRRSELERARDAGMFVRSAPRQGERSRLPPGAAEILQDSNPRLAELRAAYRAMRLPVTDHSLWNAQYVASEIELTSFRADNAFVWQHREGNTELRHLLTTYYLQSIDTLDLLPVVHEDGLFGVTTYQCGGRLVSRDLLDSLFEIYFLERHLGLSQWRDATILDIGAGYGRLAHRISQALPRLRVLCVDAIPESTFLCEYYLRFREVDTAQAEVIPLPDVEARMDIGDVTLATNIHSFDECPLSAIRWWLDLLSAHRVRYLMVVPTADRLLSREQDGSSIDFLDEFEKRGYRLIAKDHKYLDPSVQRFGVSPKYHFLFERSE